MILLTGASGLLGHNVLITLLQRGEQVIAPLRDASRLHLPASLAGSPNLHIIPMAGIQFPLPESATRAKAWVAEFLCYLQRGQYFP